MKENDRNEKQKQCTYVDKSWCPSGAHTELCSTYKQVTRVQRWSTTKREYSQARDFWTIISFKGSIGTPEKSQWTWKGWVL